MSSGHELRTDTLGDGPGLPLTASTARQSGGGADLDQVARTLVWIHGRSMGVWAGGADGTSS